MHSSGLPNCRIGYNKNAGNNSFVRNVSERLMPMDTTAKMYALRGESPVHLFSKLNKTCFVYFEPENIFKKNENR